MPQKQTWSQKKKQKKQTALKIGYMDASNLTFTIHSK